MNPNRKTALVAGGGSLAYLLTQPDDPLGVRDAVAPHGRVLWWGSLAFALYGVTGSTLASGLALAAAWAWSEGHLEGVEGIPQPGAGNSSDSDDWEFIPCPNGECGDGGVLA